MRNIFRLASLARNKAVNRDSFTLIELIITISIIGILAATVVVVVNPAQLLEQGRDGRRISDLNSINQAISTYVYQGPGLSGLGSSDTVYVSLPDTTSTCSNLNLPTLPGGWSYHCVTQQNLFHVDGTGWMPVNLTQLPGGSPLSHLSVDPTNSPSTGEYYTYVTNQSSYELTAEMEANKNRGLGTVAGDDGGENAFMYEIGSALNITDPTALNRGQGVTINGVKIHVIAEGDNAPAANGGSGPNTHGIFDSNWNQIFGSSRSYNVSVFDASSNQVTASTNYDVYGNPSVANPAMVNEINSASGSDVLFIYTFDEPQNNRMGYDLGTTMYSLGASSGIFGSPNFKWRSAYILIAQPGKGVYIEEYKGDVDSDPNAWISL